MDARSLLRAKKAEARIDHPYAAYNAAGVLRCSICAIPVKQWDAHLLTKQHRQSVAREKALQAKQQQKRAAPEPEVDETMSKRARVGDTPEVDDDTDGNSGIASLPAGFFSDGNKPSVDDGDPIENSKSEPKTGDQELDDFLASLDDDQPVTIPGLPSLPQKKGYVSSSTAAIPTVASYEAPAQLVKPKGDKEAEEEEKEPEVQETEEERRARIAREEKEEIMARLEEEERAQEDADSRVTALKARMEALKRKKEARKDKSADSESKKTSSNIA